MIVNRETRARGTTVPDFTDGRRGRVGSRRTRWRAVVIVNGSTVRVDLGLKSKLITVNRARRGRVERVLDIQRSGGVDRATVRLVARRDQARVIVIGVL